jgi:hypothetical protein
LDSKAFSDAGKRDTRALSQDICCCFEIHSSLPVVW